MLKFPKRFKIVNVTNSQGLQPCENKVFAEISCAEMACPGVTLERRALNEN